MESVVLLVVGGETTGAHELSPVKVEADSSWKGTVVTGQESSTLSPALLIESCGLGLVRIWVI